MEEEHPPPPILSNLRNEEVQKITGRVAVNYKLLVIIKLQEKSPCFVVSHICNINKLMVPLAFVTIMLSSL